MKVLSKITCSVLLLAINLAFSDAYSSYSSNGVYGSNFFADSASTYYDGYQQAWRYLGWYVKCGYPSDRYDDDGSGSHESQDNGNDYVGNNYCQRYLIWAAYVDEGYQGGGFGEYSYYDPYSGSWDKTACNTHGNGRCVPMDCHENNSTNWTLMGVFKEASYFGNDALFEQLFKHEGVCLWQDDDLYEFMSDARESSWTQGCVNTGYTGDSFYFDEDSYNSGNYLYLDLKPTWNGNMTYGLYTDSICKNEYEGMDVNPESVAKSMGLLYGSYLDKWNEALEVYKVCQPCKSINKAANYAVNYFNENGYYGEGDDDSYYSDPNEGYFQCDDDAGYTNVNQCMKFRTHAELEVATWEDLVTATNQGGILQVNVGGTIFGSERMSKEHHEYLMKTRRKELAEEAKKKSQQIAQVSAIRPEAQQWESRGQLTLMVGAVIFAIALMRLLKRMVSACKRSKLEDDEYSTDYSSASD